ncbi:MAG: L-threonylcarbamoyladenylate synthase [Thermomicrobiales bacterium]
MSEEIERTPVILDPSSPRAIEWTAERLRQGGVVSFPTDTVYALAASLSHSEALDHIFRLKGRGSQHPLPVLLAAPMHIRDVAAIADDRLIDLADQFWPGPLTIVLPARDGMPVQATGFDVTGRPTVAVRVPAHFLAIEVIERAGGSVAATSANISGEPPACSAAAVMAHFGHGFDLLLDGGHAPGGVPSTIVAMEPDGLHFVREGAISRETVEAAWAEIVAGS